LLRKDSRVIGISDNVTGVLRSTVKPAGEQSSSEYPQTVADFTESLLATDKAAMQPTPLPEDVGGGGGFNATGAGGGNLSGAGIELVHDEWSAEFHRVISVLHVYVLPLCSL